MCIGLNYTHHAEEANVSPTNVLQLQIPSYPVVFTKPADALAGPYNDVFIHPDAQSQLDYEGELSIVIGKDAKNVSESDALDYVLGYTVGNDVSARNFQIPASVSGNQYSYAKSFDRFAPIGPSVLLAKGVDPQKLHYTTKVNGEKRQETRTDDMIWTIKQIIAHLTRGTTLRKGTAIMTGTPSGIGLFVEPKGLLKNGDVVEIEVDGVGSIANKMVFEN
jgi:2-keto-4-pentenoate hydratase/2-oxohepta-3-ene-1,7-dioic acid hydratase in catechol pathway